MNIKKETLINLSLLLFGTVLIYITYLYLWSTWILMLIIWIGLALFIRIKDYNKNLFPKSEIIFNITIFAYPFFETIIKYLTVYDVIPYSWVYLNRLEHFLWAVALGILMYPFLVKTMAILHPIQKFLFIFGIIMTLGIFNEIFEFVMRIYLKKTSDFYFAAYYKDTIYDMIMNIIGGVVIGISLSKNSNKNY